MKLPTKISLPWYFGSVAMAMVCLILFHLSRGHQRSEATQATAIPTMHRAKVLPPLPDGVGRMLGHRPVFAGPQLDAQELVTFLSNYRIDHIIDLAHEAKAEKHLKDDTERRIANQTGATYWPLNIEGAGSQLNERVLATIDSLMDSGEPVYVHCLHGIHRVGVAKGRAYARDGRNWPDIIGLLRWEKVVDDRTYDRYCYNVRSAVVQKHISK